MKRGLSFERYLHHSPERVWKALTDSRMLSNWYLDNDFSPVVGQKFTFYLSPDSAFTGQLCGEVIRADAPHQLIYSFWGGPITEKTVVTWTLVAEGVGTLLTLHHTGFYGASDDILNNTIMTICPSRFLYRLAEVLDTALRPEV